MPASGPFRVLHAIPTLGAGGAERQLPYVAGALRALGTDVHVATLAAETGPTATHLSALRSAGATVHRLSARSNQDPRLLLQLVALARRLRPDVLQTWLPMMDVLGGLTARLVGVPWVLTERTSPADLRPEAKLWVREKLARRAAAVVSNSAAADRWWAAHLPPRVLHRAIGNALPLEAIASAPPAEPASVGVPEGRPLVLYVGRFAAMKNLDTLTAALDRVLKETDAAALLIGDGPIEPFVREWIAARGHAGRVAAPGFRADVWSWMKRARVFVSLSRWEGMPNAVMEAAACGCPLVLSDIPAHRDVVGGDGAAFVPTDDPGAVAAALVEALGSEGARTRAERARARSAEWSAAAIGARFAALYGEVARPTGAPR